MNVEERLDEIGRKQDRTCLLLETLTDKFEERVAHASTWRTRVERTVWGIDGNRDDAVIVRVDRLEQSQQRSRLVQNVAIGALVTCMVGAVWTVLVN
mgnify:CR=1 FL=1